AFTLAEVLITLAIIGVVAAMTIPTLVANYQEKQTVTALRKFQTNMTQAYLLATVDVNGTKGPNTMGKDTFTFMFTNNGLVPDGDPSSNYEYKLRDDDGNYLLDAEGNNLTSKDPLVDCNRQKCNGECEACTAWVIENGNMDYLHCDDLSWNGKRKCSD
ncbi:prepilin-type N-terminal cleavage/methylation domain-containing protein, partial [bacterium]|nr:prepilin-type N-terminal cleavage/methylation domain-containing protein [bacterium]